MRLNRLIKLDDQLLQQVTGGTGNCLQQILEEINSWLAHHPQATRQEIYAQLKNLIDSRWDELTPEERESALQLLASFAC